MPTDTAPSRLPVEYRHALLALKAQAAAAGTDPASGKDLHAAHMYMMMHETEMRHVFHVMVSQTQKPYLTVPEITEDQLAELLGF